MMHPRAIPFAKIGDPYHGGFHPYRRQDHVMVWMFLDGWCGAAGCFLYYSYIYKVKTMSFERAGKSVRARTYLPMKLLIAIEFWRQYDTPITAIPWPNWWCYWCYWWGRLLFHSNCWSEYNLNLFGGRLAYSLTTATVRCNTTVFDTIVGFTLCLLAIVDLLFNCKIWYLNGESRIWIPTVRWIHRINKEWI